MHLPGFLRVAGLALLASASCSPNGFAQSIEDKAGQMIIVGFRGDAIDDASVEAVKAEIAAGTIGGVMYLQSNIASRERVREMNDAFTNARPDLPPFLAVDQEGGSVQRLTSEIGFPDTPSAAEVAATDQESALSIYETMARGLADLGFNLNFGPVVDLNINKNNPIIAKYGRSYGDDVFSMFPYAFAFIDTHHGLGLLTAIKHFPGHGSSTGDTHDGFVDITQTWQEAELSAFRYIIKYGMQYGAIDMVMVGHLYNRNYVGDEESQPASLSPLWINGVLRQDLKFGGVVITDDLEMGAIRRLYDMREAVLRAVRAGVDVLLFSNTADYQADLGQEIRDILVTEAEADPTFKARIEESYERIVCLKQRIGVPEPSPQVCDSSKAP